MLTALHDPAPILRSRFLRVLLALTFATSGCSEDTSPPGVPLPESVSRGQLSIALSATADGESYRLRDAVFDIVGPLETSLRSEDVDPDAITLSTDLPAGDYEVTLEPGWRLERLFSGGYATVDAFLVGDATKLVHIGASSTSTLSYLFSTSGVIIPMGDGTLDIGVEVREQRPVLSLTLGGYFSCVTLPPRVPASAGAIHCWGNNESGQLGYPGENLGDDEVPAEVPALEFRPFRIAKAYAGGSHVCVTYGSGEAGCWGDNGYGQASMPASPFASTFGLGAFHTCSAGSDSVTGDWAECWGRNGFGQLGHGNTETLGDDEAVTPELARVDIAGPVVKLTAGGAHTCALIEGTGDTAGVRCWGNNQHGQLGNRSTENLGDDELLSSVPPFDAYARIGGGRVLDLSAGGGHTCIVQTFDAPAQGYVMCWGDGAYGQLGYGNTGDIGDDEAPITRGWVDLPPDIVHVTTGRHHTCALNASGAVRCWGRNNYGQLGYGHTNDIGDDERLSTLGEVDLGGRAVLLEAGDFHTCALLEDNELLCWGLNNYGQLGYGHTQNIGDDETPREAGRVLVE